MKSGETKTQKKEIDDNKRTSLQEKTEKKP